MTLQQGAAQLRMPFTLAEGLSTRALALLALVLCPLFMAGWQFEPLYVSNQNTKFLHALTNVGVGYLKEDWLANTKDGLPLFTLWLEVIYKIFGEIGFYCAALISHFVFLFASLLVYQQISRKSDIPAYGLFIFLPVMFVFASLIELQYIVFHGLSDQYTLGGYYQTADFGVFLILSVVIYCRGYFLTAIASILLGAAMHPGYVMPGAVLIGLYLIYEWLPVAGNERGRKLKVLLASAAGIAALIGIALALKQLFRPTDPQLHAEAHRILTEIRIPHHTAPGDWLGWSAVVQLILCAICVYMLPPGRLRFVLKFGVMATVIFIIGAFFSGTETYRLIAPWRVSVVLVPIASMALVALVIVKLHEFKFFERWSERRIVGASLIVVLACAIGGTMMMAPKFLKADPSYISFVRNNLASGQIYLTTRTGFRLETGAPQFVTLKSHPYQDFEVLEWYRRLGVMSKLYQGSEMNCDELRNTAMKEKITHVMAVKKEPSVSCDFASQIFRDGSTRIYQLTLSGQ